MPERAARISDAAVKQATGKAWHEWLLLLDLAGAAEQSNKDIVNIIAATGAVSPWWCQTIATHYRRSRQQKVVGQTDGAGFEMGAQHTLPLGQVTLWNLLASPRGLALWLGETQDFTLTAGAEYALADGTHGVIRALNPPDHIRLTWQPANWATHSTLQIRLIALEDERTSLRIHHERLPDEATRLRMRQHWQTVLRAVSELIAQE